MIVNEDGINWCHFTELKVANDGVEIISKTRLHKVEYSEWPEKYKKALYHPEYYHSNIWKEDEKRTALEYNVPGIGWRKIINPKHIFDYYEKGIEKE
jgi:hypothetical protein